MIEGGAILAALSGSTLATNSAAGCFANLGVASCAFRTEANKTALWSGIGLTGAGAVTVYVGARPVRTEISVDRGRATLSRRFVF
jgi:hypothetical protein